MPTPRRPVVLGHYPVAADQLAEDLRPVAARIQRAHGAEEWIAALLTHELHQHLGLYSLIGVKMGIRARELLGAGLDELEVRSLAGRRPPRSCLNDGLQVATGATLGRGTITISEEGRLAAHFVRGRESLGLQLVPPWEERAAQSIAEAHRASGGEAARTTAAIRAAALRLWLELDRREGFEQV